MTEKIPMRFRIIQQLAAHKEGLTPQEIYRQMPVYAGERQYTEKEIDNQLMSLKTVGLAEIVDAAEKPDGALLCTYRLTGYGENRVGKYVLAYR